MERLQVCCNRPLYPKVGTTHGMIYFYLHLLTRRREGGMLIPRRVFAMYETQGHFARDM